MQRLSRDERILKRRRLAIKALAEPEQGEFFDPQGFSTGLTGDQYTQLAQHEVTGPEAFRQMVRFWDRHIDDLHFFASSLAVYKASQAVHQQRQASNNALATWANNPDETIQKALGGAGVFVMQSRESLRAQYNELALRGEYFAGLLIRYLGLALPGQSEFWIYDQLYETTHGALTYTAPEGDLRRTTFFGSKAAYDEFASDNYIFANAEAGNVREGGSYISWASLGDWQNLIGGLQTMAEFQSYGLGQSAD